MAGETLLWKQIRQEDLGWGRGFISQPTTELTQAKPITAQPEDQEVLQQISGLIFIVVPTEFLRRLMKRLEKSKMPQMTSDPFYRSLRLLGRQEFRATRIENIQHGGSSWPHVAANQEAR